MTESPKPTGLRKECPRCGRVGDVFVEGKGYTILWPQRSDANPRGADPEREDTGLNVEDLLRPTMGCGYD